MDDFTNLTQAQAALADPATSAEELMAIAQAQPTLWVAVASHSNAYSGLLDWLNANGDETVRAAVATRRSPTPPPPPAETASPEPGVEESSVPDEETPVLEEPQPESDTEHSPADTTAKETVVEEELSPAAESTVDSPFTGEAPITRHKPSIPKLTPRLKKILIAASSALVVIFAAVLLIVNLVIVPKQAAAEAAAAEQARIEQEHQAAVDAFTDAAAFCDKATQSLASEISAAQTTLKIDPATMNDPTLIDALKTVIATAQALPPCTAPSMVDDTATIAQQAEDLTNAAATIGAGSSELKAATTGVTTSVQAKKDAETAAKAAEEQARKDAEAAAEASRAQVKNVLTATHESNGYTWTTKFELSDLIKGTDTELQDKVWSTVNGRGSFPVSAGSVRGDYGPVGSFERDRDAIIVGRVTMTNTTTGFVLPAGQDVVRLLLDGNVQNSSPVSTGGMLSCFLYSNDTSCAEGLMFTRSNLAAGASVSVPFVTVVKGTFGPDRPNGWAREVTLTVGTTSGVNEVALGTTW